MSEKREKKNNMQDKDMEMIRDKLCDNEATTIQYPNDSNNNNITNDTTKDKTEEKVQENEQNISQKKIKENTNEQSKEKKQINTQKNKQEYTIYEQNSKSYEVKQKKNFILKKRKGDNKEENPPKEREDSKLVTVNKRFFLSSGECLNYVINQGNIENKIKFFCIIDTNKLTKEYVLTNWDTRLRQIFVLSDKDKKLYEKMIPNEDIKKLLDLTLRKYISIVIGTDNIEDKELNDKIKKFGLEYIIESFKDKNINELIYILFNFERCVAIKKGRKTKKSTNLFFTTKLRLRKIPEQIKSKKIAELLKDYWKADKINIFLNSEVIKNKDLTLSDEYLKEKKNLDIAKINESIHNLEEKNNSFDNIIELNEDNDLFNDIYDNNKFDPNIIMAINHNNQNYENDSHNTENNDNSFSENNTEKNDNNFNFDNSYNNVVQLYFSSSNARTLFNNKYNI
jgi:hypothetical protein